MVNTKTLSPEMIQKLTKIMTGMVNDPEGRAALKTVKMAAMPPMNDSEFDPLRKILAKKKELKKKKKK